MNVSRMLQERAAAGRPIRIGQIGAAKFGTMLLAQVRLTRGMHLVGLADPMPQRARERLAIIGCSKEQFAAASAGDALKARSTFLTDNALPVIANPDVDVVIEPTGDPATGVELCLAEVRHGKHIVMVN